jgi:NADPH-dependent 2,4-dienoyl-CoA reductase/sulfur reductase-like enzyme
MTGFDVVVIGAGPAGMAASVAAAQHNADVCLIDDNAKCGGQIWRGHDDQSTKHSPRDRFAQLQKVLESGHVELRSGAYVVAFPAPRVLRLETSSGFEDIRYRRLILAAGARERFLPFPGWTLQGVMGAGGLQAMMKAGLPIHSKRAVLSGSGPLLLAVAANLARSGARILGIFEQARLAQILKFGIQLLGYPAKLREGAAFRAATRSAPYRTGSWVVEAHGDHSLQSVTVSVNGALHTIQCDYLGCGFHLVPNLELPRLLQCQINSGYVCVNESQETSVEGVYCAGEPTGIGGLEKALCEGEIAGLACAGRSFTHLFKRRHRYMRFARQLDEAFALRTELKQLLTPDTFICRCEDVPRRTLDSMHSWREAKLHARCGMGPCQGRICGPATEFLFGWNSGHPRPPVFPARVSTLASPMESAGIPV